MDFVQFVAAHRHGESVGAPQAEGASLWLRRTDQTMPNSPLSVAADKLAKPAARCAYLQSRLRDSGINVDRSGLTGRIIEAYPAAAFHTWGFTAPYKKASGAVKQARRREAREKMAHFLIGATEATGAHVGDLAEADDHLDAFACALIARAARVGEIANVPTGYDLDRARAEGWIHLPSTEALTRLV